MKPLTLIPTVAVAIALGITPGAVRKLCQRGVLTRHGPKTRALYDLDEVNRLDATRRARAA